MVQSYHLPEESITVPLQDPCGSTSVFPLPSELLVILDYMPQDSAVTSAVHAGAYSSARHTGGRVRSGMWSSPWEVSGWTDSVSYHRVHILSIWPPRTAGGLGTGQFLCPSRPSCWHYLLFYSVQYSFAVKRYGNGMFVGCISRICNPSTLVFVRIVCPLGNLGREWSQMEARQILIW